MLTWTGERYLPELEGNIALEHLHRYAMACQLAKGRQVLDIACGEGYGSAMLAEVAQRVIGVDISQDVIAHARLKYRKGNLEFKAGSCSGIPIQDASVDLVVSFETIEHDDQHEAMLSEIKRVLSPNGVLIISSPEKLEYSVLANYSNPYHVKELYRDEFEKLMASHFKHIAMYGQRVIYGSGILQEEKISDAASFSRENGTIKVTKGIARPLYLIAVASDGAVPEVASGFFEQPINESISELKQMVAARDERIASLDQSLAEITEEAARRAEWLLRLQSELAAIISSNSWRFTLPFREARRWVSAPQAQSKRYAKAALRQLGRRYQALPLSAQTKALHRNWIARHAPRLLLASGINPVSVSSPSVSARTESRLLTEEHDASTSLEPATPVSRASDSPLVSVVVPVCGKIDNALRCLKSIQDHPPAVAFEIILVHDGSPDAASGRLLSNVPGCRLILNTEDPGFNGSCNAGANAACGDYLLFLNNDTEVRPDWADALLRAIDGSPRQARQKLAAVTMVYNEALILPYFLHHYRYLDEIHVLYETDSTDRSLEILMQAPNVVIAKCHIEGGLDDIEKIGRFNKALQRIRADWVYVVDPDEFVFPPRGESPHAFLQRQSCDVVRSGMYQVYRHRNDSDLDPSAAPIPQRIHGDPDLFSTERRTHRASNSVYVKPNIVRPSKTIRFLPGHHQIEGDPRASSELFVGAHWQMADPEIAIARRMERKARVSERNRALKMGWQHFDISIEKIKMECERHLDDPIIEALRSFTEVAARDIPAGPRPDDDLLPGSNGGFDGTEAAIEVHERS